MPRLDFILCSSLDSPLPSTRISALRMIPFLQQAGFSVRVAWAPAQPSTTPDLSSIANQLLQDPPDVVYFQKVTGDSVVGLARALRARGVATIFGVCDLIDETMLAECDATIVVTDYLRSLYSAALRHKVHVVHDGLERPDVYRAGTTTAQDGVLKAVMVAAPQVRTIPVLGSPPRCLDLTVVANYGGLAPSRLRCPGTLWTSLPNRAKCLIPERLQPVALHRFRPVVWSLDTVYDQLRRSDLGIIPIDTRPDPIPARPSISWWQVRSENRLTLMMSSALPVIATPIPAYEAVLEHGRTGYFARSRQDWIRCIKALRDPAHRAAMGTEARQAVIDRFSASRQAVKLIAILRTALDQQRASGFPTHNVLTQRSAAK